MSLAYPQTSVCVCVVCVAVHTEAGALQGADRQGSSSASHRQAPPWPLLTQRPELKSKWVGAVISAATWAHGSCLSPLLASGTLRTQPWEAPPPRLTSHLHFSRFCVRTGRPWPATWPDCGLDVHSLTMSRL